MKVTLQIKYNSNSDTHELETDEVVILGRSSKSDILISDEKVSARHCRLFLKKHRLEISDLNSKNGTYLNGIRIDRSEIFVGDQIKIGDSILTLDESSMDEESINAFSFPGSYKDRINFGLRADFTGARIQNQTKDTTLNSRPRNKFNNSHDKEIDIRKSIQSKLKLSKQEIRARNKLSSLISLVWDGFFLILFLMIPPLITASLATEEADKASKTTLFLTFEMAFILIYLVINFRMNKFSIGEKLSGIKKIYQNQ